VDEALSETMLYYWTSFAVISDPNDPRWPPGPVCDSALDEYLDFDSRITIKSGLFNEDCELLC
jgi:carboxylesterase type B